MYKNFIADYAQGAKSAAVKNLIEETRYSREDYGVSEDAIYEEISSPEWNQYVDFIVDDTLLDFQSIA